MNRLNLSLGGRDIGIETGRIAKQASGSVIVTQGETVLLVTAQADSGESSFDFFPLTVEYREKIASVGKIPGGFLKREGRITDREILTSRLIDRSIRPLFPSGFRCETQIIATLLSADPETDPGTLAVLGASAALHLSEIPWQGPAASLRIARCGEETVILPGYTQRQKASLDFAISSGPFGLCMVEGMAKEIPEAEILDVLIQADDLMTPVREQLDAFRAECGREKRTFTPPSVDEALRQRVHEVARERLTRALQTAGKHERKVAVNLAVEEARTEIGEEEREGEVNGLLGSLQKEIVRKQIIEDERRIDGRGPRDIRPIECEVGWLPRTHGSAVFTRGETQAVVTCTLAPVEEAQRVDHLFGEVRENFLLHYNFPPYSVGETRPMRGPGRREIGHGNLARSALQGCFPSTDQFAYTVRVESDITESNGSSSMATTCGGCLAMMDAGVPLTRPVAGIAMGLVQEGESIAVLSDILGDEDHLGDMDFKVTGTKVGVTAMQMDNKIGGLSREVLEKALSQAHEGRLHILAEMGKTLGAPREEVSARAPRVETLRIRPERIAELIGPKGSTIQELQSSTQTRITVDDSGLVSVFSTNPDASRQAVRRVRLLVGDPHVGHLYRGKVTGVKPFGAFVRIIGGAEGLVHVSELDSERVAQARDIANEGDTMVVRVLGVDGQGKLKLSRKSALSAKGEDIHECV